LDTYFGVCTPFWTLSKKGNNNPQLPHGYPGTEDDYTSLVQIPNQLFSFDAIRSSEDRMQTKKSKNIGMLLVGAVLLFVTVILSDLSAGSALAASAREIDARASQALKTLYQNTPGTQALAKKAKAIPIFPSIVKGGFIVAGQYGDGALRKRGKTVAYYRSLAASYGFQAGAQSFGYILFFMDEESLRYLDQSNGWELGTGPSLVVLDTGFGKNLSTTTLQKGVYAFIFGQKGLMGGVGIQGSKITRINPDK
jgi:lipid-binding SYLF domain-containing protein